MIDEQVQNIYRYSRIGWNPDEYNWRGYVVCRFLRDRGNYGYNW